MAISREELLRLARSGAANRVQELQEELESIFKTFPDLRTAGSRRGTRTAPKAAKAPNSRRAWSAADRRAVSERMKKYWAARRNAKSTKTAK
ncbi:MAG: hypothetical protein QM736_22880 [Vicinamibacterales bacterium]